MLAGEAAGVELHVAAGAPLPDAMLAIPRVSHQLVTGVEILDPNIYGVSEIPCDVRADDVLVICAIALVGFSIELLEGVTGNSTPDRGIQMTEALFSLAWIGLGAGLWLTYARLPDDPQLPV